MVSISQCLQLLSYSFLTQTAQSYIFSVSIMFSKVTLIAIVFSALSSVVTAHPTAMEVIPGPGLPSLESLGLTSAELYAAPSDTSDGEQLSCASSMQTN